MTKQEIIDKLVKQSGIKKRQISYVIDNFLDNILSSCDNGDKVEIRGFGSFCRADRKGRQVFSPIAGKHITLPARSIISFKASKTTEKVLELGRLAQLGEHLPYKQRVGGSIPSASTILSRGGAVRQLVRLIT